MTIARIQAQLHASARRNFDAVAAPPFTIYINPDDAALWSNYAIPDVSVSGDLSAAVADLCATFTAHQRQPRFEYLEDFAPALAPQLERTGFVAEARTQLMICMPDTLRSTPPVPGLHITQLAPDAPVAHVQDLMTVQRRAFGEDSAAPATPVEAAQFRQRFVGVQFLLARIDGQAVAVASVMQPHEGITELAGIATLAAFRRRGIASAVTAHAVRAAFEQGLDAVFLTAADAQAGRVYERVGFRAAGAALAYHQPNGTAERSTT